MSKEYDTVFCCEKAKYFIMWLKPDTNGPKKEGWAIFTDDSWCENINYCPWCGTKLEDKT